MNKKNSLEKYKNYLLDYKNILQYETIIIFGFLIAIFAFTNIIGLTDINSDLFWMFAGIGLVIDGSLEQFKWRQKKSIMLKKDKELVKGKKDKIWY